MNNNRVKLFSNDDPAFSSKINKIDRKVETEGNKVIRASKSQLRGSDNSAELKDIIMNSVNASGRNNGRNTSSIIPGENGISDPVKSSVERRFSGVRSANCSINVPSDNQLTKSKEFAKKLSNELGSKFKNFQTENSVNHSDYKARSIGNLNSKLSNQISSGFQRENNQYSRDEGNGNRNSNSSAYAVARKTLEQQTCVPKVAPMNFPPLRAPQSIVNVRHPFVTEARTKHGEVGISNGLKTKPAVNTIMQSKELEPARQTYHNFSTSALNIANMSAYPRPDPFPQPTLTSVLFPDTTGQFSQSASSFSTNQLNQFQTYDPSYHASTTVIPQFSDNSISFPQYDSATYVQPNHYPAADLANNQFQYQTPGVGQIQDSPLFIQSLQNPIAITDQYATPNYARAVRTELIHRLRRPPRFSK